MRSVEKPLANGESVLIPRKGSLNNVMYVNEEFWTVDTMFFTVPRVPGAAKYAFQYIKKLDLESMNSGSAVPSMTTAILNALELPIPDHEALRELDKRFQPMYKLKAANKTEIEQLSALRDAILPKLMSGEIDVSNLDLTQLNNHLFDSVISFQLRLLVTNSGILFIVLLTMSFLRVNRASMYTFFDIETPNLRNDRICSIGLVVTDNYGSVEHSDYVLINPEARFDNRNMEIHGIAPVDVQTASVFSEVWENRLAEYFNGAFVVAHNASFDLAVLFKTISAYQIAKPQIDYACTMRMASQLHISSSSGLPALCSSLGVTMETHHNALSDARACSEVFWKMVPKIELSHLFTPYTFREAIGERRVSDQVITKAMVDLYGYLVGLSIDGTISSEEIQTLRQWINDHKDLSQDPRIKYVFSVINHIIADGLVTIDERRMLFDIARSFVVEVSYKEETLAMQELLGILQGVVADEVINAREARNLLDWIDDHEEFASNRVVEPVFALLEESLEDGIVTKEEEAALLGAINGVLNPSEETESIEIAGKTFCLSGDFCHGPKSKVEEYIVEHGGKIAKSVTKKCNYVVIGESGSERYAYGNYGTKAKKALELKVKGQDIEVIKESLLF